MSLGIHVNCNEHELFLPLVNPGDIRRSFEYPEVIGTGMISALRVNPSVLLADINFTSRKTKSLARQTLDNEHYKLFYFFSSMQVDYTFECDHVDHFAGGMMIISPPGADILWEAHPSQHNNHIYMSLERDFFEVLIQEAGATRMFHNRRSVILPVVRGRLKAIMESLRAKQVPSSLERIFLEGQVMTLLALLLAEVGDSVTSSSACTTEERRRVLRAREILESNLCEPPSLEELSRMVILNRNKLQMGFREVFGTTVYGFLRDERLTRAFSMLEAGEGNVTRVAYDVGYENLSHFAEAFRKKFGVLPREIRSEHWARA